MPRCACEPRITRPVGSKGEHRCWACYQRAKARGQQKSHIKHRYGITLEQYAELLEKQGGKCAICGGAGRSGSNAKYLDTPRTFDVDHDHITGRVRGLLCNRCNRGVLQTLENYSHLIAPALEYLQRYKD